MSAVSAGGSRVPAAQTAGSGGPQSLVNQRPERPGIEVAPGHHRELVVRDPIRTEDDEIALHGPRATGAELGELDGLDALIAVDRADRRARPDRRPVANPRPGSEGGE